MKPRLQALLPVLFYLSALFLDHHLFPPAAQYSQYAAGDQQNDIDGVLPFIALERSAGERRPAFRTEFHAWGRPLFLTQHNADPARNSGG
jgi:hypothetical protein